MTRRFARMPVAGAALLLAAATLASLPARSQGTDAQREACAPDAIKLCSDTIPDVATTTTCMRRHYAQLSSRCKIAFDAAAPAGGTKARGRTVTREPDAGPPPATGADLATAPAAESVPGLQSYEAHIRQICRDGLVDAFTCRNTLDLLQAGE